MNVNELKFPFAWFGINIYDFENANKQYESLLDYYGITDFERDDIEYNARIMFKECCWHGDLDTDNMVNSIMYCIVRTAIKYIARKHNLLITDFQYEINGALVDIWYKDERIV